jgi:hypothetical protein
MRKSRVLSFSLLLVGTLTAVGCHSGGTPASSARVQPVVVAPAAPAPDATPPAALEDDAGVLARKTRQYARDMSSILDQQQDGSGPVSLPASRPSVVEWGDLMRESATPGGVTPGGTVQSTAGQPVAVQASAVVAPTTQPSGVSDDRANRPASLAAAKANDDVPQILPESADHITDSTTAGGVNVPSDDLEKKLYQNVLDYPRDLGNQLDYELLRFVRDESTPDLSTLSGLTSEDKEVLSALLDGINNFRNTVRADGDAMLGQKIQPLVDMVDRLHQQAELAIPVISLCTRVDSFAVYKALPTCRFPAGADNEVIVYSEVANFTSALNNDKMWETRLKQEMTLYTEGGMAVWPEQSNQQLFVDVAHSRRHDFFIARKVQLPQALTIGRYLLKVTITDPQSSRVADATTPIEIIAE